MHFKRINIPCYFSLTFSPSFALFIVQSFSPLVFLLSPSFISISPPHSLFFPFTLSPLWSFLYPHLLLIFYLLFPSIVVHSLTLSLLLFSCSLSLPLSLYRLYVYINSRIPRGKVRIWADLDPQHWDSNYTSYLCLHLPEARVGVWVEGVGVGSGSVRTVEKKGIYQWIFRGWVSGVGNGSVRSIGEIGDISLNIQELRGWWRQWQRTPCEEFKRYITEY